MSIDTLVQAIDLIKAGEKQAGQQLLAEVVRADPNNETAWLWLASVAPIDKRRFCLERVLKINPDHVLAKQLISQLPAQGNQQAASPQVEVPAAANPVIAPSAPAPVNFPKGDAAFWVVKVSREVRIIFFQGTNLIAFDMMPDKAPKVLAQMNQVAMTKEWYVKNVALGLQRMTYKSAPIDRVLRVRSLQRSLKLECRDEKGEDFSVEIYCKEDAIADAVMSSLQKRLGEKYASILQPTSRANVVVSSAIIVLIPVCVTAFFYWGALQPVEGNFRARLWIVLLVKLTQFLGPNGVLCVGGIFILLGLAIAIYSFAKPPIETLLIRKSLLASQA